VVLTGRFAATGLVLAILLPWAWTATYAQPSTGVIRGRFTLPAGTADDRRPALIEPRNSTRPRQPRVGVVYLEVAPSAAFETPVAARERMDQRNETFVPHVLAIRTGTTVDFPNSDRVYHNVFSLSPTRRFDLGRYAVGRSKSVRFDRPGVVRVFCDIHSHMSAFILVFAHRYFAATDSEGRWRIDGVPPGAYTLAVWNDGAVRARRELRVGPDGEVAADFELE